MSNFSRIVDIDSQDVLNYRDDLSNLSLISSRMSDPSDSIADVNVPEVRNSNVNFVYNFYTRDERVAPSTTGSIGITQSLQRLPRYNILTWEVPTLSSFEIQKQDYTRSGGNQFSIKENANKIISEDNFFDPGYVNHSFTSIDAIEQGSEDIETYSRISRSDAESVFKMSKSQLEEIASSGASRDVTFGLAELADTYSKLANFPKNSLGLRVFSSNNTPTDDDEFLKSVCNSVTLNLKINSSVIPDIFSDSSEKNHLNNLENLRINYEDSLQGYRAREGISVSPVKNDSSTSYLTRPVKIIGYIVDKYLVKSDRFVKQDTFYVEDPFVSSVADGNILYGASYVYSIRTVASVNVLTYNPDGRTVDSSTLYVASRPVSVPIECFEYTPPPEPENLKFSFDYVKRNLIITWDMPVNPQKDVKQFQVFRRKSIKEPFELIAQYGFDRSETGSGAAGRYKTGERVDANNYASMRAEDKYLVKLQDPQSPYEGAVRAHVDEDFVVDTETRSSSTYIYAISSVDAHGMISNYSSQHLVTFDSNRNRLISKVVCDQGSPRQYPNLNLRADSFKDTIRISGQETKKLNVYFTPEYLKVKDENNSTYRIVESQRNNGNSYYLVQFINLDNQKLQLLKINVQDPESLTL